MDPVVSELLNLLLRWSHVVAGVLWLGVLYSWNVVYLPHPSPAPGGEGTVVRRVYSWARWSSLWTWVSGLLLLGVVYHAGGLMVDEGQKVGSAIGSGLLTILLLFFVYDGLWKSPLRKSEPLAVLISTGLFGVVAFGLSLRMSGRALFIHLGGLLGTIMLMNLWMRIWPAQRKLLLSGTAGAQGEALAAGITLRAKHNIYLSVPLTLFMVSNHFPTLYGGGQKVVWAISVLVLGFLAAKLVFFHSKLPERAP